MITLALLLLFLVNISHTDPQTHLHTATQAELCVTKHSFCYTQKFCHLLILLFQTCMTFFFLLNTMKDILKTTLDSIGFHCMDKKH